MLDIKTTIYSFKIRTNRPIVLSSCPPLTDKLSKLTYDKFLAADAMKMRTTLPPHGGRHSSNNDADE